MNREREIDDDLVYCSFERDLNWEMGKNERM